MIYNNVRPDHMQIAKLITEGIGWDTVADYYPNERAPANFIDTCKMIVRAAKIDVPDQFDARKNRHDKHGIEQWLRGLPSICSIPFSNYDIWQFLTDNGTTRTDHVSDDNKSRQIDRYWLMVASLITMYATK